MPEVEPRFSCPVCFGLPMAKLEFPLEQGHLVLDSCERCGGIWFDQGEIQQLKQVQIHTATQKIALAEESFQMQCHACHTLMDRNADACPSCSWKNRLDCPMCAKPMQIAQPAGLKLDYCKSCKGAWFDNIELAHIWNGQIDLMAQKQAPHGPDDDHALFVLEVLAYSPDLVFYGTRAAVEGGAHLITHAPDIAGVIITHTPDVAGAVFEGSGHLLTHAPEIAGAVFEGAGDVAGGVFGFIADILGGLFSS